MGFKEAFTRQGEGENLLFDDDAFNYFALSLLSIFIMPLAFIIIKPWFTYEDKRKFQRVPKSKNDQDNLQIIKKELKYKWLTKGYIFKVIVLLFLLILLKYTINQLPQQNKIKGFDPYEILEISVTATEPEIRKAFRKKSVDLHPDKNPDDPQANQKFILLTKAYECLTDKDKKDLCLKFGNPDGQQSLSVGIAMPSFLLKKENRALFLALIFLILIVVIPIIVLNELKSIGKYDDNGIQLQNIQIYERGLEENLIFRKCPLVLCATQELQKQKVSSREEESDLNKLVKIIIEEAENKKISNFELAEMLEQNKKSKQNKRKFIVSKSIVLLYAHLFGKQIPQSLFSSYRYVIYTIPKILHSMVSFSQPYSMKQYVEQLRRMGKRQARFIGIRCISTLLNFSQCIIQGLYETDNHIRQIGFFYDEYQKYIKKSKLPEFQELLQKKNIPNWVPEEYKEQILSEIEMFPRLKVEHSITVDDDTIDEFTIEDLILLKITLTRENTPEGQDNPVCHSNRFTYIRDETWHVFICVDEEVFYYQKVSGPKKQQFVEFKFIPRQIFDLQNVFDLTVVIKSDCYRGLDQEIVVKFNLKRPADVKRSVEYHQEDQELDKEIPYIQQVLNPFSNQNGQEDTDSEKEEEEEQTETKKPKED
ncbi:hypothetical protein pb186bvf_011365 [Paramecium bursaria]